jgi:hypothetical protein
MAEENPIPAEFETVVGEGGVIRIPDGLLKEIGSGVGRKVRVRLSVRRISEALKRRGVTEAEVDRISGLQLEARERVIRFLLSEGVLAKRRGTIPGKAGRRGAGPRQ